MNITTNIFDQYITNRLEKLNCTNETKAYIKSILKDYIRAEKDLSNKSITILYAKARNEYAFDKFQNIGDYLFFIKSIFPDALCAASPEYYNILARSSYYRCHIILNKQWPLFEELSDNFEYLVKNVNSQICRDIT